MQLHGLSAREIARRLRESELTAGEVVEHYLARIERLDDGLGAFAVVTAEAARQRAAALTRDEPGALWGLPHAEKDLVARAGVATGYGSRARAGYVPTASDPLAVALDGAGAVSLGKTATPEFGLTGYTEPVAGVPTRDPWNPENGAGGSSGGAAVAVAAGMLPVAVGSDGGGSVRIPAATVGVVGLKPSRGRLAIGSGLDGPGGLVVNGPLARTADDAAFLLDTLCGMGDYSYATRAPKRIDGTFSASMRSAASSPLHIGVTTRSPWDDDEEIALDPDAERAVQVAAAALSGFEHDAAAFEWQPRGYAQLFRTLWRASAARIPLTASELEVVEPITAWLVREGRALSAPTLLDALAAATLFERETIAAFSPFDAVLTPALAQAPRPIGSYDTGDAERAFVQQVQYAPYSSFVNVAGLPAIVVPVTTDATGHPVSVQLIGRPGGEATILALAAQLEAARGPLRHPQLW